MSHEKKPAKQKPPYHVSIKEAATIGYHAEDFAPDSRPNRRARVARVIAARATLAPTLKEFKQADAAFEAQKNAKFEKTKAAAQGANKKVLAILEKAVDLPNDLPPNTSHAPLDGSYSVPIDHKHPNRPYRATPGHIDYMRMFSVNDARQASSKEGWGTAYLKTADEKPLTITVKTSEGNSMQVPINTMNISYTAPVTVDGERYASYVSSVGAGSTRVTINQRHYDPAHSRMYVNYGQGTQINQDGSFDGQLDFSLTPDGQLQDVSMGRNNSDSMVPADEADVDVNKFLRDVDHAIFETQMIAQVPDDPSKLL